MIASTEPTPLAVQRDRLARRLERWKRAGVPSECLSGTQAELFVLDALLEAESAVLLTGDLPLTAARGC